MKRFSNFLIGSAVVFSAFYSAAQELNYQELNAKLEDKLGWKVETISNSPVKGLLQLNTERGIFYASEDGTYVLQARIFNMDEAMRNETDAALASVRLEGIEAFKDDMIEFKAKDEKYAISVFTDITCGYCRRLHEQIAEYNDAGITIRYMAFPRQGVESSNYNDMVSVWCAKDPKKALTDAKFGEKVASSSCANKVEEQFWFGQKVGVNGTPAIVLPNGQLVPGYQPPPQLLDTLQAAG